MSDNNQHGSRRNALYDSDFFDQHDSSAASAATVVFDILAETFSPTSVVDVGCGSGKWLIEAQRRFDSEICGIDGRWNSGLASLGFRHRYADFEDEFSINERFDLAVCLEVAEHLTPTASTRLIDELVKTSDVVLFSGAVVGQPGVNHINCRRQSEWMTEFENRGYVCLDHIRPRIWEQPDVAWWYKQNLFLAVTSKAPLASHDALLAHSRTQPVDVIHPENYESTVQGYRRACKDLWTRMEAAEATLREPTGRDVASLGRTYARQIIRRMVQRRAK